MRYENVRSTPALVVGSSAARHSLFQPFMLLPA